MKWEICGTISLRLSFKMLFCILGLLPYLGFKSSIFFGGEGQFICFLLTLTIFHWGQRKFRNKIICSRSKWIPLLSSSYISICVFQCNQRAKLHWWAGRIWPAGCLLRTPDKLFLVAWQLWYVLQCLLIHRGTTKLSHSSKHNSWWPCLGNAIDAQASQTSAPRILTSTV